MSAVADAAALPGTLSVRLARLWALGGVTLLLARPSFSLAVKGWRGAVLPGLGAVEWVALVSIVGIFVWSEGVMALARRWSPRIAGRIRGIDDSTPGAARLVAPLHVLGLAFQPRGTIVRNWAGVAAIVSAVVVVRAMPHPWRGMVELGVSAALAIGLTALLAGYARRAEGGLRESTLAS